MKLTAHHQALVRILMNALSTETHAYARKPNAAPPGRTAGRLAQLIEAVGGAFSLARALFRSTVCRRG